MKNEERSCFQCGAIGERWAEQHFWKKYAFNLVWCQRCEVGWVRSIPETEVFIEAYERLNVLAWKGKTPESLSRDIKRAYLKGYRVGSNFLRLRPGVDRKKLRVLEVGSNIGAVLRGCQDALGIGSDQVIGVDFSKNHAEVSRVRFGILTFAETLSDFSRRAPDPFDLIVCHHIIEHDERPSEFLLILRNLCKSEGIVSFELPNGYRELRAVRESNKGGVVPNTLINHINFFSPKGFRGFLKRNKFKVLSLSTLNANDLLKDLGFGFGFGCGRRKPLPEELGFADVPNLPVLPVFESAPIERGIAAAQRAAPFINIIHRRLRVHYPDGLPFGRDIEAYVTKQADKNPKT